MPIDGPDIVETHFLEQGSGRDHSLHMLLGAPREITQHLLAGALRRRIESARHQLGEILVERPYRRRDRHFVVIEHHQQVHVRRPCVIERFERHAGGHRAVADHRYDMALHARELGRHRHAESGADGGARMRSAEGVVLALATARKARQALPHPHPVHLLAPAGQHLVAVGLVAHVPHNAVVRGVEDVVQRNGQLDRPQIGREMAAGLAYRVEQERAQLLRQLLQLFRIETAQLVRVVYGPQQVVRRCTRC